ncbi:MAG TPA: AraC family transcriptional regulator [Actinoplanes sp.]
MTSQLVTGAPERHTYRASTVDEIQALYSGQFGRRVSVTPSEDPRPLSSTIEAVQVGPIQAARHTIAVNLRVESERDDVYGLGIGKAGRLTIGNGLGHDTTATRRGAVAVSPASGPLNMRAEPASKVECLVIDNWALEAELEDLIERPVSRSIRFGADVDLNSSAARGLLHLVQLFVEDVGTGYPAVVVEPLCHALLSGLLLAVDHPYRELLEKPAMPSRPRSVKRAVDAIHASPEQPFTAASLADLAGVSTRTLQAGFRLHLGVSPMEYLRQVRLARAHDDLTSAAVSTVSEAAYRWGFNHLGRFAAQYRRKYGKPPSATIHPG